MPGHNNIEKTQFAVTGLTPAVVSFVSSDDAVELDQIQERLDAMDHEEQAAKDISFLLNIINKARR